MIMPPKYQRNSAVIGLHIPEHASELIEAEWRIYASLN